MLRNIMELLVTYIVGSCLLNLCTTQMATHSKIINIISTEAGTATAGTSTTSSEVLTGTEEGNNMSCHMYTNTMCYVTTNLNTYRQPIVSPL